MAMALGKRFKPHSGRKLHHCRRQRAYKRPTRSGASAGVAVASAPQRHGCSNCGASATPRRRCRRRRRRRRRRYLLPLPPPPVVCLGAEAAAGASLDQQQTQHQKQQQQQQQLQGQHRHASYRLPSTVRDFLVKSGEWSRASPKHHILRALERHFVRVDQRHRSDGEWWRRRRAWQQVSLAAAEGSSATSMMPVTTAATMTTVKAGSARVEQEAGPRKRGQGRQGDGLSERSVVEAKSTGACAHRGRDAAQGRREDVATGSGQHRRRRVALPRP